MQSADNRNRKQDIQTIYLAGGCFWGIQRYFDQFDGVLRTEVGYANGRTADPAYEDLHETGHAETVRVDFDASVYPLEQLLDDYIEVIDPFTVNRQGPDIGTQYRTGIYYTEERQLPAIEARLRLVEERSGRRPAVEAEPLSNYYTAEEYHQKYLERIPWGYCHVPAGMFRVQERRKKGGK